MLKVLQQRNFSLLWLAGLISMIGDWMLFIALPMHTYNLTHSSLATGLMFMAGTLPRILLGSVAGVFVDRWNRKHIMVVADLSRAVLVLVLLWVQSPESIWIVYVVAFLESIISQFFGPAENALLPQLVESSDLVAANSLNTLNNNLARLGGPALGGLLLGSLGFQPVIFIDSLSFLVSGILIASIARSSPTLMHEEKDQAVATSFNLWEDWLSGLHLIWSSSMVSAIFLVIAIASVAEGLFNIMFVIFIYQNLRGGALEFGWLTSAQAIGGLMGALVIGWLGHRVSPNRLTGLMAVNGILILLMVSLPSLPWAIFLILLAGIPLAGVSVGINSLLQAYIADRYRGRIFGALGTSMAVCVLLGQGCATLFGDRFGSVSLLTLKGILDISAGLIAFVLLSQIKNLESNPDAG